MDSVPATFIHSGYLSKKKGSHALLKTWNRKWFVLSDTAIWYFDAPSKSKPAGKLNLHGARLVVSSDPHHRLNFTLSGVVEKPNAKSEVRTIHLAAPSDNALAEWLFYIKRQKEIGVVSGLDVDEGSRKYDLSILEAMIAENVHAKLDRQKPRPSILASLHSPDVTSTEEEEQKTVNSRAASRLALARSMINNKTFDTDSSHLSIPVSPRAQEKVHTFRSSSSRAKDDLNDVGIPVSARTDIADDSDATPRTSRSRRKTKDSFGVTPIVDHEAASDTALQASQEKQQVQRPKYRASSALDTDAVGEDLDITLQRPPATSDTTLMTVPEEGAENATRQTTDGSLNLSDTLSPPNVNSRSRRSRFGTFGALTPNSDSPNPSQSWQKAVESDPIINAVVRRSSAFSEESQLLRGDTSRSRSTPASPDAEPSSRGAGDGASSSPVSFKRRESQGGESVSNARETPSGRVSTTSNEGGLEQLTSFEAETPNGAPDDPTSRDTANAFPVVANSGPAEQSSTSSTPAPEAATGIADTNEAETHKSPAPNPMRGAALLTSPMPSPHTPTPLIAQVSLAQKASFTLPPPHSPAAATDTEITARKVQFIVPKTSAKYQTPYKNDDDYDYSSDYTSDGTADMTKEPPSQQTAAPPTHPFPSARSSDVLSRHEATAAAISISGASIRSSPMFGVHAPAPDTSARTTPPDEITKKKLDKLSSELAFYRNLTEELTRKVDALAEASLRNPNPVPYTSSHANIRKTTISSLEIPPASEGSVVAPTSVAVSTASVSLAGLIKTSARDEDSKPVLLDIGDVSVNGSVSPALRAVSPPRSISARSPKRSPERAYKQSPALTPSQCQLDDGFGEVEPTLGSFDHLYDYDAADHTALSSAVSQQPSPSAPVHQQYATNNAAAEPPAAVAPTALTSWLAEFTTRHRSLLSDSLTTAVPAAKPAISATPDPTKKLFASGVASHTHKQSHSSRTSTGYIASQQKTMNGSVVVKHKPEPKRLSTLHPKQAHTSYPESHTAPMPRGASSAYLGAVNVASRKQNNVPLLSALDMVQSGFEKPQRSFMRP